ncbi:hypothetical protein M501DRAFT_999726 [Patellaria atrata CBS 101060]|uniref:Calcium permease n=1 Tax=Patellaria atrata CBS 101060 TaxID=1346257 RepID=A0A9P4S4D5_9PEZI|nr:hypothetical protein M501DRAFT_999726 [Patellaria atrata CBS 101060]
MADGDRPQYEDEQSPDSPTFTRRPSSPSGMHSSTQSLPSYQDPSSSQTSETLRRRPPPSQHQSTVGYGSIVSPRQSQSTVNNEGQSSKNTKKPTMPRRTSRLHRGQEFSVDDAQEEVDRELEEQKEQARQAKEQQKHAKMASGSVRAPQSTLRRRPTGHQPTLPRVDSEDRGDETQQERAAAPTDADNQASSGEEGTLQAEEELESPMDDDDTLSDAESFTLKDRQEAINDTHPFGIRIWKPALYKKNRSVQKTAEGDIHSSPGGFVSNWLFLFNIMWTLLFGWWLGFGTAIVGLFLLTLGFTSSTCLAYGKLLWGLAGYLFYPFGKYVKLLQDEAYAEEDEGEGRSISEYERWQSGDIEEGRLFFGPVRSLIGRRRSSVDSNDEGASLLGRTGRGTQRNDTSRTKNRLFGRGEWNLGRVIFFIFFYGLLTPMLFFVSAICWLLVFSIPMGRVTVLLFNHLRRHPLALSFHNDSAETRRPGESFSILLCTYRAVGTKYWKYTIDGQNIILINLLSIVAFTIFDYWVLDVALGIHNALTAQGLVFIFALASIIPLAYFIGQAVASISAQSSMGVGATVNAFFSTVVEVFLYCVALKEGKAQLVEGSIIGSIFAGILFLPGLSMCFGALKRKTQRFNVKSAGVTSTMLLFAVIGAFGPTLFYQIYGSHELNCHQCRNPGNHAGVNECRRCYFSQRPAIHDRFYVEAVRPYIWFAAVMLFLSYIIGLLFTLRTHAAVIWNFELDEKKVATIEAQSSHLANSALLAESGHSTGRGTLPRMDTTASTMGGQPRPDIRDSALYKRILGQSLKEVGLSETGENQTRPKSSSSTHATPHVPPPRDTVLHMDGLTEEQNQSLVFHVAEMAATAAAVAARDAAKAPRKASQLASTPARPHHSRAPTGERPHVSRTGTFGEEPEGTGDAHGGVPGGHDAPNWSRTKSAIILLTATVAYAVIAEILVNTVDSVLDHVDIDEKFLGITLFALVPNTTEFLNAISFAMNGNIALSMEIGSAYALQVCLLQIPALVFFSAIYGRKIDPSDIIDHTFTLIFPQWDMVTVILCVFLLSYMYGEGKSNYFKGSILILSYLVVVVGFYYSGFTSIDLYGVDPTDTLAIRGQVEQVMMVRVAGGKAIIEG